MKDVLSTVTPWPAVVETLDFVLTNCSRDENDHPEIIFREKTDKEIESLDKPSACRNAYGVEPVHMLPKISVIFDIKNREERVLIWTKDNLPGPDGNTVEEKILQSPLAYLFECYTSCWQSVGLQLADDGLARLVTYVLELTGYTEDTELDIEKYFNYGCADKSKVIFADQDIDYSAILRTFDIIRELRIDMMDWVEMSLSAVGDKESKLRLRVYSEDSQVVIVSDRFIDSEELEQKHR